MAAKGLGLLGSTHATTASGIVGAPELGNINPNESIAKFLLHHSRNNPARSLVVVTVNVSAAANDFDPANADNSGPPG